MEGPQALYDLLDRLGIAYTYHEHPPVPTAEEAARYWKDLDATGCKNLFLRNHKGNRHYLVILEHTHAVVMRDLEQRLRQGKLSLASEKRLQKYLGLAPGSVSPFGLINDREHHVHLFIDRHLQEAERLCFHPNVNTATLVISFRDFLRFLDHLGNTYEFLDLY